MNYICSDGVNSTTVPVGLYEMNVTSRTGRFVVRRERPIPLPSRSRPRDPPSGPSVSDCLSSPCQRCPPASPPLARSGTWAGRACCKSVRNGSSRSAAAMASQVPPTRVGRGLAWWIEGSAVARECAPDRRAPAADRVVVCGADDPGRRASCCRRHQQRPDTARRLRCGAEVAGRRLCCASGDRCDVCDARGQEHRRGHWPWYELGFGSAWGGIGVACCDAGVLGCGSAVVAGGPCCGLRLTLVWRAGCDDACEATVRHARSRWGRWADARWCVVCDVDGGGRATWRKSETSPRSRTRARRR